MAYSSNSDTEGNTFISLTSLVAIALRNWFLILILTLLGAAAGVTVANMWPNEYTVRALLPPDESSPAFSWVLKSEQVGLAVANELDLGKHYGAGSAVAALPYLGRNVQVRDGTSIEIAVSDDSPEFAAKLLNTYLKVALRHAYDMRLTPVAKQIHFLKLRREEAQANLAQAEALLGTPEAKSALAAVPAQVLQRLLGAMRVQASVVEQTLFVPQEPTNREGQDWSAPRLQEQLLFLQRQMLDPLNGPTLNAQEFAALSQALAREYWTELGAGLDKRVANLDKEYELRRTFLEVAPPVKPSGPMRVRIIAIAIVLSFMFATFLCVAVAVIRRLRANTLRSGFVDDVKRQW
ncbi:Wzz/FepE/Etk N-terminal domain-containing protein [Bordetella bronchiseptica]|uniref:Wzz/FepE/Etk N-terminal domain-containing protein n=1 Tax=Bordetella bronchiseptica TaxID=518 RepID=UPI00081C7744|nr:Wzz/FepE/Etk N-terminal domain-containing protein [Bordetella bronchiseptica]AOB24882.1 hypothetical protein BBB44_00665 [Bordetella bronchiseptica]AZW42116.1 hypothetical protein CWR61_00670 [Bordetella bronchiseptica]